MAASDDWRSSLTASERYENIQRIQQALATSKLGQTAFAVESEAYNSSHSREEYNTACTHIPTPPPLQAPRTDSPPPSHHPDDTDSGSSSPGVRIGPYNNCHYVASGITASVYRSPSPNPVALKVITETRDLEPHNPAREAKILAELKDKSSPNIITLLSTLRDQEQRFVLVFPYMPFTLASLLSQSSLSGGQIQSIFRDIFSALASIHGMGIIHRDIKPSAILLSSPTGPAYLSDFGTAWHPTLSLTSEPASAKILDIGTGPYRAPECLFGDKSYTTAVDLWGAGAMLAECCRDPPRPLFESRPTHEDGNQLGLILSIFKTLGSPTRETWPGADRLKTSPVGGMYRAFEGRGWGEILPDVGREWRELVSGLVRYSGRVTAGEALEFECLKEPAK